MANQSDRYAGMDQRDAPANWGRSFEGFVRFACQSLGLIFVAVGAYFLTNQFVLVAKVVQSPKELDTAVTEIAGAINADKIVIVAGAEKVPIGKAIAVFALFPWWVLWIWAPAKLVSTGGRLVLGPINERREFFAAIKEFAKSARELQKD